jgi:hypothetical protein
MYIREQPTRWESHTGSTSGQVRWGLEEEGICGVQYFLFAPVELEDGNKPRR